MSAFVRADGALATALEDLPTGVVFQPKRVTDDWMAVSDELTEAFRLTKQAMIDGQPVVYVVRHPDLLGRGGAGAAMVAAGLLSGARTAAFEGRKVGIPINVLAVEDDSPPEAVARWVRLLLESGGPTGELVRLGGEHLGRALP